MANIHNYNMIVDVFRDIANRHLMVNSFFVGDDWLIGASDAEVYPLMTINPTNAFMNKGTIGNYASFEVAFDVTVTDILDKDRTNEQDIVSDTLKILRDITTEFTQHPYYVRSNFQLVGDLTMDPIKENFDDDEVKGWTVSMRARTPNTDTFCGIPVEDITDFSFPSECGPCENVIVSAENYYTTGATLNGSIISFDRNDTLSAYTVDLSSIAGGGTGDTHTTGFTYDDANQLTILRNNGEVDLNVNVDIVTGLTVNGSIQFDSSVSNTAITDANSNILVAFNSFATDSYEITTDGNGGDFTKSYNYLDATAMNFGTKFLLEGGVEYGGLFHAPGREEQYIAMQRNNGSFNSNAFHVLYAQNNKTAASNNNSVADAFPVFLGGKGNQGNTLITNSVALGGVGLTMDKDDYAFANNFEVQGGIAKYDAVRTLTADEEFAHKKYVDSKISQAFTTLTSGATVTWDMDDSINAKVTLGGNSTLVISGVTDGQVGLIKIIQDATGSRTLTLPANSLVINGGAGAITLTTTANAVDVLSFVYDGTDFLWTYGINYN